MKILLAVDGSESAGRAIDAVRDRPWPPGSTVRVLTVVRDVLTMVPASGWAAPVVPVAVPPPDLSTGRGYLEARDWLRKHADLAVDAAANAIRREVMGSRAPRAGTTRCFATISTVAASVAGC